MRGFLKAGFKGRTLKAEVLSFPKSEMPCGPPLLTKHQQSHHLFCVLQLTGKYQDGNSILSVTLHGPSLPSYGAGCCRHGAGTHYLLPTVMLCNNELWYLCRIQQSVFIPPCVGQPARQLLIWNHSSTWGLACCQLICIKPGSAHPPLGQAGHLPMAILELQEKLKLLFMFLPVSCLLTSP